MKRRRQSESARNAGTLIALVALLLAAIALLALVAVVWSHMVFIVMVVGGFFLSGLFHYVTWGWWLSRVPFDEEEAE